ncbi:hypothetical protein Y032_0009g649 [Ancylostoma ceylanicum]|uniref:Uncharacterized protein n=1 Tax=Ancylostoma ceylanicum TaxID=53326 RepID=A0A016VI74_9BILA|nr:hypothetical protein Y032_0009g649 [Ancylostoma ceylanicum]
MEKIKSNTAKKLAFRSRVTKVVLKLGHSELGTCKSKFPPLPSLFVQLGSRNFVFLLNCWESDLQPATVVSHTFLGLVVLMTHCVGLQLLMCGQLRDIRKLCNCNFK